MTQRLSKIERAKALKAVKAVVPPDAYKRIKEIVGVGIDLKETDRAVAGLAEEDEFALFCRLMNTATHLVHLEQRPIIHGDYIVPDFLARFQPGFWEKGFTSEDSAGIRCLVDVKSTSSDKFSIGGSPLRRRRNFANTYGLPLLFALPLTQFSQSALWVIVEDDNPSLSRIEIGVDRLITGVRHVLWDEYFYFVLPSTWFQATYSKSALREGVRHPEYGVQIGFDAVNHQERIHFEDGDAIFFSMFFHCWGLTKKEHQQDGDLTHVAYVPSLVAVALGDVVYKMNRLLGDDAGGETYDASRILAQLDQPNTGPLISRQIVEGMGDFLLNKKFAFVLAFGDTNKALEVWRRFGGKK